MVGVYIISIFISAIIIIIQFYIFTSMSSSLDKISKSLQILTKERPLPLIKKYEGEIERWKEMMKYADANLKKRCKKEIITREIILNKLKDNEYNYDYDRDNTYND